jgi:hypothetical protein
MKDALGDDVGTGKASAERGTGPESGGRIASVVACGPLHDGTIRSAIGELEAVGKWCDEPGPHPLPIEPSGRKKLTRMLKSEGVNLSLLSARNQACS